MSKVNQRQQMMLYVKTKNIDMSERKAPEVLSKGGFKVKSVS